MKRCRFIPPTSITVQNQVIDLNKLLHNVDPYLGQQYLRLGTYDANVSLDDPDFPFDRRDFDIIDVFEYEKAINQARFMPPKTDNNVSPAATKEVPGEPSLQGNGNYPSDIAPGSAGSVPSEAGANGFERI